MFFVGFIVSSFLNYYQRFKVKYNPLQMFPYELNYEMKFKENLIGNLFLIGSALGLVSFYTYFGFISNDGFIKLVMIAGLASSLLFSFIVFTPIKYIKLHLSVDVLSFILTFMVFASTFVLALLDYQHFETDISLVIIFISGFFGVIYFFFLLNPKLSKWMYLDKEVNSDGSSYFKRPKFFPLAYTEWLTFVFLFIGAILVFIESLGL